MTDAFGVPTLDEVLKFVSGYNADTGATIGVYPESKTPSTTELNTKIVEALNDNGFTSRAQKSYIQTFDHAAAAELAALQDDRGMDNGIVALGVAVLYGSDYYVYDVTYGTDPLTPLALTSLSVLAGFADGVGVVLGYNLDAGFVAAAHALGLEVHGWTFSEDDEAAARDELTFYIDMGLDGLFTNYTDIAVGLIADLNAPQVPLPASLPLLLAGVAPLVVRRRRQR